MDLRSFREKLAFRNAVLPNYLQAIDRTPEGDHTRYNMKDVEIGNLEWKSGYNKIFDPATDPPFRDSKPWDTDHSSPENITQTDECLLLTKPRDANSKDAYLYSNFTFKYGTVRALIKLPNIRGAWSAFWLFGNNEMPEHDILEHCGHKEHEVSVTHHWGYDYSGIYGKKSTLHNERYNKNFNPTENYYLYEVEIGPYKTVYRINGVIVRTVKKGLGSADQHILLDVTRGEYCNSSNNQSMVGDAIMKVKFIEVFKMA